MKLYRDWALEKIPPFHSNPTGEAWVQALGDCRDAAIERLKAALKARFPDYAAPDALNQLGGERGLDRGPTDTDSTYAARLKDAWTVWGAAGTPTGVLNALWDAGYTNVILYTVHNTFTLDGSRSLVTTTFTAPRHFGPDFWNSFLVVFPQTLIAAWVSGGVPGNTSAEADNIRRLVNKWRPAHALNTAYVVQTGGPFYGQSGLTFGAGGPVYGPANTRWDP